MTFSGWHPQEIRAPKIRFLCEQDGPPERTLKERLAHLLRFFPAVKRAYLVKIDFGAPENSGVVLAVRSKLEPDRDLVEKVGEVFASVFNAEEHLDVIFLNDKQEAELTNCCKPFFE